MCEQLEKRNLKYLMFRYEVAGKYNFLLLETYARHRESKDYKNVLFHTNLDFISKKVFQSLAT